MKSHWSDNFSDVAKWTERHGAGSKERQKRKILTCIQGVTCQVMYQFGNTAEKEIDSIGGTLRDLEVI